MRLIALPVIRFTAKFGRSPTDPEALESIVAIQVNQPALSATPIPITSKEYLVAVFVTLQPLEAHFTDTGALDPSVVEPLVWNEHARPLDCTSVRPQHKHWGRLSRKLVNLQLAMRGDRQHRSRSIREVTYERQTDVRPTKRRLPPGTLTGTNAQHARGDQRNESGESDPCGFHDDGRQWAERTRPPMSGVPRRPNFKLMLSPRIRCVALLALRAISVSEC